jgi:hypothetical protein
MIINPNWGRWLKASVTRHFSIVSKKIDMPIYLDRYDRDSDWVELRTSGPYITEPHRGFIFVDYNVDILITTYEKLNAYKIDKLCGIYASELREEICVYAYGDGEDDDHSLIGALKVKDGMSINVHTFNLILPEAKFKRSSVETDLTFDLYR